MMRSSRLNRRSSTLDIWPGFVDALSTLLLAIIFLLTIFVLGQYFLSQDIAGRDTVLARLNRQIAELTDLLALERGARRETDQQLVSLRSTLGALEADKARLEGLSGQVSEGAQALQSERETSRKALDEVALLNQQIAALRRQLAALEQALDASEARGREAQTRITDLGARLNVALAQRVQELARYRSDFFGRLREILGNEAGIRIVGDRFVVQSELLFDPASAVLKPEANLEMDRLANALLDLEKRIPPDLAWILRVDGHTDVRPIATLQFPSNWALSAARAIAVVQALNARGVPAQRLAATGFGEFQPVDLGSTEQAYARNRRIELKVTER